VENSAVRDEQFEWDDEKASINAAKHGVTFEEARHVFTDDHAVEFLDTRRDYGEDRYIRVGSIGGSVLVVAVAYTERGHRFRIISAMPAPKALRKLYEDGY
jgi:uncharacterized DUF497 family protein